MLYNDLATEFMSMVLLRKGPGTSTDTLSKGEMGTLLYLSKIDNNVVVGRISNKLEITSGRMASVLKSLERKNLIIRSKCKIDSRQTIVSITTEGTIAVENHSKDVYNHISNMMKFLGEKDAKEFVRIQKRVFDYQDEERENEKKRK